jgi:hypothetical protein
MSRCIRLVGFLVLLSCAAPGCLALYSTRPVTITVVDPDSDRPLANVPVVVEYRSMGVLNTPNDVKGVTDANGRVTLPMSDFDDGVMLLKAGGGKFALSPEMVCNGVLFETERRWNATDGYHDAKPEGAVELCPHALDLWRIASGTPRKMVHPNPSLGLPYDLPRCNYIMEFRVAEVTSGKVLWRVEHDTALWRLKGAQAEPPAHVDYGKVPDGMRETATAETLKKGDRIRLEVTYQYDANLAPTFSSKAFHFEVLGPNRFRRLP